MLGRVDAVLAPPEEDDFSRAEFQDLKAELRTNAAAGTGHENGLAAKKGLQPLFIEIDLRAFTTEQVPNLHVAQIADAHLAHEEFVEAGRDLHVRRMLAAQLHDFIQLLAGDRRDGDDDLVDVAISCDDPWQNAPATEDFKAMNAHVAQRRIVVDEAQHAL